MSGCILLEGGGEFGGQMALPDRRALELAGGLDAAVCILPTAAAPDHNDRRAGQNGLHWFRHLGARQVSVLPLIDRASADQEDIAAAIQAARLVYLLGGFTHYLGQTLAGSRSAQAIRSAYDRGAVIAGSSAGAMVLCQFYYHPQQGQIFEGLNFVPGSCVIPHHNTFGKQWAPRLAGLLPGRVLIGIDEQTGVIQAAPGAPWSVLGAGTATLYRDGQSSTFRAGQSFSL